MPGSPVDSDEDMLRMRTELAEQKKRMLEEKKRKKEEEAARIKAQNKAMRDKIKKTKAATDNNIADDVTADGKTVGQLRAACGLQLRSALVAGRERASRPHGVRGP